MNKEQTIFRARERHREVFNAYPLHSFWAPGRIEVLGNHTDYNQGTTLSAAIDRGICFCISHSSQPGIHVHATDVNTTVSFDVTDTEKIPHASWANYIKGVCHLLQAKTGQRIDGVQCTFFGSIPIGAGLSSSAALEVSAAYAVNELFALGVEPKEIALICQQAEHQFAGTHCGLLDQFSSIFGKDHGLLHIDFQTLAVKTLVLPDEIEFLVIDTRAKHALSDSPYNDRRRQCELAVTQMSQRMLRPVHSLRDVSSAELAKEMHHLDPLAARRAAHIVGEIDRVQRAMEDLAAGNIQAFGQRLNESHLSSRNDFENSSPELDLCVEAALQAGAMGARLQGGGFGGSAIAMVHQADANEISERIMEYCTNRGLEPEIIEIVPSTGAQRI